MELIVMAHIVMALYSPLVREFGNGVIVMAYIAMALYNQLACEFGKLRVGVSLRRRPIRAFCVKRPPSRQ